MAKSEADLKIDFATGLKELEEITTWFESDNLDLDKGLAKFERGMELIAQLKKYLGTVENQVQQIKSKFAEPSSSTPSRAEEPDDSEPELFAP